MIYRITFEDGEFMNVDAASRKMAVETAHAFTGDAPIFMIEELLRPSEEIEELERLYQLGWGRHK